MNRSGQAVAALANFFRIKPEEILVARRTRPASGRRQAQAGGGHGGHNGLRDIIAQLGNQNNFHRLRLGIGHPGVASMVSTRPGSCATRRTGKLDASIDFALGVLPDILAGEWNRAMKNLHSQKA
jgi:PTH1 family peptidyl-tRNA hydrolase